MRPGDILAAKQKALSYRRLEVPVAQLQERISRHTEPVRSLTTIRGEFVDIVGEIRPPEHPLAGLFDPRIWGQEYAGAGCAAVAVCTDTIAHRGDSAYSRRARRYMPLPVISLDYVIDEYQLYEARLWQSDAVTVPEAFLSDGEILHLMEVSAELQMTPVIMTDTVDGAKRAVELGAGYLLAMPLVWDGSSDVSPADVDCMAQICPDHARLIGYVPLLQREAVEQMAGAGAHAVLGAPASYDPSEAAIMLRQLQEIPRRVSQ